MNSDEHDSRTWRDVAKFLIGFVVPATAGLFVLSQFVDMQPKEAPVTFSLPELVGLTLLIWVLVVFAMPYLPRRM